MVSPGSTRPRVSRETRLLLVTILISIAALWALARIRFPNRPAMPSPVPPLLTQLAARPAFDDLASEISTVEARLLHSLAVVDTPGRPPAAALRVRDDIGAFLIGTSSDEGHVPRGGEQPLVALDRATGLALTKIPGSPAPDVNASLSGRFDRPHYVIATDVSREGVSSRPVFLGRLHAAAHPAWPGEVLALPVRASVAPGDFLFTLDGALMGLVVGADDERVLVPGDTLLREIDRLLRSKRNAPPTAGIEVQALTPSIASATGATEGVIVAAVAPDGPAAGKLAVMDVIEAVNGEPVRTPEYWRARLSRIAAGESMTLRVRSKGAVKEVPVMAAAPSSPPPVAERPMKLGLRMRTRPGTGVEVVRVEEGSSAAFAGLREGDLITMVGDQQAPTAGQIARTFEASPAGRPLLVAVTRGGTHHVLALERR
jgi:S1-C subfamily serine protease